MIIIKKGIQTVSSDTTGKEVAFLQYALAGIRMAYKSTIAAIKRDRPFVFFFF